MNPHHAPPKIHLVSPGPNQLTACGRAWWSVKHTMDRRAVTCNACRLAARRRQQKAKTA